MIALLGQLARAGVAIFVENGRLRQRSPEGTYTPELRALVEANRPALIEALTMPGDHRARAAWLGRLARLAGIDAAGLFRLVDYTLGDRALGPYQLTVAETEKIAVLIRAEIGKRAPIVDPQVVGGAGAAGAFRVTADRDKNRDKVSRSGGSGTCGGDST